MVRALVFDGDKAGIERFDLVFGAFILGGNQLLQRASGQRSRDDRAKEAKVLRALKAIGEEIPIPGVADATTWRLAGTGGTVVLDQKQHELLLRYVEAAPLPTQKSDVIDEVLDWIAAAPPSPDHV